jgi:predicted enzyme related to lactoylglutathione lyase
MRRDSILVLAFLLHVATAFAAPLGPDGPPGRYLPGKFVWFDLATEDPAGARAFYGAVFGWTFREVAGSPRDYLLIESGGVKVGGVLRHTRPAGAKVGARWLSVVSVRDVARAAELARSRGGEVLLAPRSIRGRGTHAVLRDPEGAVFGVLAAEGGDPPDTPVADGEFYWLDLFARDPAKAAAFYAAVAGLEVDVGEVAGRPRTLLSTGGVARAGVARLPAGADRPGWLPYVLVPDVPAALERARRAGGRVVLAPRADLLGGNLAIIADPLGGIVGVVNWEAR